MTTTKPSKEELTPVAEARARILAACPPLPAERVLLTDVALDPRSRRLAVACAGRRALPPFTNSAMDGYGVRIEDVQHASEQTPVSLTVVARSLAGHESARGIGPGEAVAVTTGAPIPAGVSAVVMRERCDESALTPDGTGVVRVRHAPAPQEHIRPRGEDVAPGARVGEVGDVLTPARVNLLLSAGHVAVDVVRRPTVAIVASGDELREIGDGIGDDVIVNSNAWAIAAAAVAAGAQVRLQGIARDTLEDHVARMDVDDVDVLVTIGGVSMGSHDFVRPTLLQLGAELLLWKIAMRPGKPLAFGTLPRRRRPVLVFGLPGNPVSSLVTFALFVKPALLALQGEREPVPRGTSVPLLDDVPFTKKKGLAFFARAKMATKDGVHGVRTLERQGSGQISGLADADVLACFAADVERAEPGSLVDVIPL